MKTVVLEPTPPPGGGGQDGPPRRRTSLFAHGEPMVWLMGGALGISLAMIAGLLALVLYQGLTTFWPRPILEVSTVDGRTYMGEVVQSETYSVEPDSIAAMNEAVAEKARVALNSGTAERRLLRTGNYRLTNTHFDWVSNFEVETESEPEWAVVVERLEWGRFFGRPKGFLIDGELVEDTPEGAWAAFDRHHGESRDRFRRRRELEIHAVGRVNRKIEAARLRLKSAELRHGFGTPEWIEVERETGETTEEANDEFAEIRAKIAELNEENERFKILMSTTSGQDQELVLAEVVRAFPPNRIGLGKALSIYFSRWREFLLDEPRHANAEGGVFPAIFGTVSMTLIMSFLVVPFGVLAALYLREYAKQGKIVSMVRIAVNNLAGVPSIVFGVFGVGFLCYMIGGSLDQWLFSEKLPDPTLGTGGIFWASLTLALLTLPVVIVATEEALSAVPGSMREGSYACGATKWQTIQRIVLPKAAPGIMTGMILAIARGAGEVAPLMLVGAVKLAPDLPIDSVWPFIHPERSFMHLGFHIYDLGFQSQNSEAAKPMVYTTTLLLILIIVALNLFAVWIRARLRSRVHGTHI